jgi:hypothetical protein
VNAMAMRLADAGTSTVADSRHNKCPAGDITTPENDSSIKDRLCETAARKKETPRSFHVSASQS